MAATRLRLPRLRHACIAVDVISGRGETHCGEWQQTVATTTFLDARRAHLVGA
jgi:hypothetical protein